MSRKTVKPAKLYVVSMGDEVSQSHYYNEEPISPLQMLYGAAVLLRDAKEASGMQYKELFAMLDGSLEAGVFRKNPTMSASKSAETANSDA